jgi:hypothetical protein
MTESNGSTFVGDLPAASDPDIDQLLHPSRLYARPADVAADELLTIDERRAILASWASDACAVDSNPPLRRPPLVSTPVTFDEIMNALRRLDRTKRSTTTPARRSVCNRRLSARVSPIGMW